MNTIIHHPYNISKYAGSITKRNRYVNVKYEYKLKTKEHSLFKTFDDYEKAIEFLKNKAIELGLVKNIVYETNDVWEVELTQGQKCIFDEADLNIVDEYVFHAHLCSASGNYYAAKFERTENTNKKVFLHNLIMDFKPNGKLSVDHINRNTLDNRKCNLRITNQIIQGINKDPQTSNKSGVVGVHFDKSKNSWVANWKENGTRKSKSFSTKTYGDQEAFNLAEKHRKYMKKLFLNT
jgi:hypothetical protein